MHLDKVDLATFSLLIFQGINNKQGVYNHGNL